MPNSSFPFSSYPRPDLSPAVQSLHPLIPALSIGTRKDDRFDLSEPAWLAVLKAGDDVLKAAEPVGLVFAGRSDDHVDLAAGGGLVQLGRGDDVLEFGGELNRVFGGRGHDILKFQTDLGAYDIEVNGGSITFIGRFSGHETTVRGVESFVFNDEELDLATLRATFDPDDGLPTILVGSGTQTVTVNDPDPTVSVVWDRTVQQAVIEAVGSVGPTIASRAYALVHTAIYDAWATYDDQAVRVSFDLDGDNALLADAAISTDANKAKAMSYAAYTVLSELFPDQEELFATVMQDRYGHALRDDRSLEAAIGIDAAQDLMGLRRTDGSNQPNDYDGSGVYTPINPNPTEINDITRWTPENVPIDPEDALPAEQSFLTPHWQFVESFALPEHADGSTDHSVLRPVAPRPFFTEAFADAVLDFGAKTITASAPVTVGDITYAPGEAVPVSKDLIGAVINPAFIAQAEEVIDYSANLTDRDKIIAEFWEDGGATAFPPGTFMSFAQFVSARDGHDLDADAKLFLAMGNAVFDAGVATWEAKVFHDYARPVRVIRDLGELGLIGEPGVDELTGETGHVIEAFGGFAPDGGGLGTHTILAENFVTFQRPFTDPSPPFAEYTSGHSGFSAAGAEVLRQFTGSDEFGGGVVFAPASTQFEPGVPEVETVLEWATFTEAADEAGLSRLYGGIHFSEGDLNGRAVGRDVGGLAFDLAESFWTGAAGDEDRPFFGDALIV